MSQHFNLIEEPWIPCSLLDSGEHRLFSLHGLLTEAHRIREIEDDSPLVTVALHRLLLAILHRNFGPRTMNQWRDLWQRGEWDIGTLDAYFALHQNRFDLFDEQYPFFQVSPRVDADMSDGKEIPVTELIRECTSGNNATLFDHSFDNAPIGVRPDVAARHLLASLLYSGGGGNSRPFYRTDAPLARARSVFVIGDNLFETLCLNLVRYTNARPLPWDNDDDPPVWERDRFPTPAKDGTRPDGYLDYLTFRVRRIHLIPPDQTGLIRWCRIWQFFRLTVDGYPDPFLSYRRSEDRGYVPILFHSERATWRDSGTLFQPSGEDLIRPAVFEHLAQIQILQDNGEIATRPAYRISVLGARLSSGQPDISFWRHERLPLPLAYLNDGDLRATLDVALRLTEAVGHALWIAAHRFACWMFVPEPIKDGKDSDRRKQYSEKAGRGKQINDLRRTLAPGRRYWPMLDSSFSAFLVAQAAERIREGTTGQIAIGPAFRQWSEAVQRAAWSDFHAMFGTLAPTAQSFQAWAFAERCFVSGLRKAMESAGVPESDSDLKGEEMVTDDA